MWRFGLPGPPLHVDGLVGHAPPKGSAVLGAPSAAVACKLTQPPALCLLPLAARFASHLPTPVRHRQKATNLGCFRQAGRSDCCSGPPTPACPLLRGPYIASPVLEAGRGVVAHHSGLADCVLVLRAACWWCGLSWHSANIATRAEGASFASPIAKCAPWPPRSPGLAAQLFLPSRQCALPPWPPELSLSEEILCARFQPRHGERTQPTHPTEPPFPPDLCAHHLRLPHSLRLLSQLASLPFSVATNKGA